MSTTPTPMGIGSLGSSEVLLSRKTRWTLSADFPSGKVPEMFIKLQSRFEESEHKQITTMLFDCNNSNFKGMWGICSPLYEDSWKELKPGTPEYLDKLQNFVGTIFLTMYSGNGELLDKYTVYNAWPTSISFVELDHSNCDETTIEIIWNYESFEHQTLTDLSSV